MEPGNKLIAFMLALGTLGLHAIYGDGLGEIHPGYEMTDIQPAGKRFLVGGVDLFSDGRMAVCNWGNPGEVWIVKGADSGSASTVKASRYAYGLQQVLGCKVVQDTLYVLQIGELTQLVDADGDGKADQYNKINDAFSTSESLLALAYDLLHFGGFFYAALSADVGFGGMDVQPSLVGRSSFIKMGRDNSIEYLATGFRNPNGMAMGFGNKMFATDNQGSWLPSSKVIHLEKGKFYGHHTVPANRFEDQPESPPLAWLPHGDVSLSPGSLLFLSEGIFKNQLLLAEEHRGLGGGRIYRVSVEDVNGVLQGAIMPFSGGIGTGVNRLAMGKDNALYAGLLGADGNWSDAESMKPGLKRLKPRDIGKSYAFEMLAVRSTGPATIEIEFTGPPAPDANDPARYKAETWNFVPQVGYGAGNKQNFRTLPVQAATLKPDGKTVVLTIGGLSEKYLVHLKLLGLKSAGGQNPWGSEAWLTLNRFGPGKVPEVAGCLDPKNPGFTKGATLNDPSACLPVTTRTSWDPMGDSPLRKINPGRIGISMVADQPYTLELVDMRGVRLGYWKGVGTSEVSVDAKRSGTGLRILRLQAGHRSWTRLWLAGQ